MLLRVVYLSIAKCHANAMDAESQMIEEAPEV